MDPPSTKKKKKRYGEQTQKRKGAGLGESSVNAPKKKGVKAPSSVLLTVGGGEGRGIVRLRRSERKGNTDSFSRRKKKRFVETPGHREKKGKKRSVNMR